MAERLQGTFYSQDGTEYRVTLFVDGYSGATDDFDLTALSLKYDGDVKNIHHPVLASSVNITFRVGNSTIRDVFSGLVGAAEESYRIRIEKGGSNDLFWAGFVIPDQVTEEDKPIAVGREFSIEAVDGIGRLKDKDYTGSGTEWEGEQTILQHFYNVLSFIPLDDLWGVSDSYLKARNQIFEDSQSEGETVSPLPLTRVNHRVFRNVDSRGRVKYKSAYEVLTELCKAFASRFYLSGGEYHLEQVTQYANQDAVQTFKRWDKSASAIADETLNDWGTRLLAVDRSAIRLLGGADLTVMSGAVNTYLSALSKVELTYNHFKTRSVLSHIFPPPTWTHSSGVEVETGPVDDNSGASRILVSADVEFLVNFDVPAEAVPGMMKFRCILKIADGGTDYYCSRSASVNFGVVSYSDAEWTTGGGFVEFYTDFLTNQGETFLYNFNFYTPQLPASGDLSVDFEFVELEGVTGLIDNVAISYSSEWTISNVYGEVYSDGTVDAQSIGTVFESTNNNDTNSDVLRPEVILGDGPTGTAFGRLQVWTGFSWTDANNWKLRGEATLLPHGARIAREVMIPRLKPAERIEGNFRGCFMAHNLLERSGSRYIFLKGTINLASDITNGTWCFITDSATLSTTPDTGVDFSNLPGGDPAPPPGPYPPATSPAGWGGLTLNPAVQRMIIDNNVVFNLTSGLETTDTGTTSILVDERDTIHNFYDEDQINLTNPLTGQTQQLTLNVSQESDKTITVTSFDPVTNFPAGSYVSPDVNWMFEMVSALRKITHSFQLVESYLEIPGDAVDMPFQMAPFFRIPPHMANYLYTGFTANYHTVGTGAGYLNVRVTADGISDVLTFNWTNTQETKTLSTYRTVNTGDLITFEFAAMNDSGDRPEGLTVDLHFIARV